MLHGKKGWDRLRPAAPLWGVTTQAAVETHPLGQSSPPTLSLLPQNGDYNKPIPAQYLEHLNHVVSSAPSPCAAPQPQQWVSSQVLLCRRCSHHQTTKIKQLAAFTPRDEVRLGPGGRGDEEGLAPSRQLREARTGLS